MERTTEQKITDRPLQAKHVLLCEGADEFDLFSLLRADRGLKEEHLEIVDAKGRERLKERLDDLRFQSGWSGVRKVGVVLDSEDDLQATEELLRELQQVLSADVELMPIQLPSPDQTGSLESLARVLLTDAQSEGAKCADEWAECADRCFDHDQRTQAQKDKQWLHVWLALKMEGTAYSRIGYAVRRQKLIKEELTELLSQLDARLDLFLSEPSES